MEKVEFKECKILKNNWNWENNSKVNDEMKDKRALPQRRITNKNGRKGSNEKSSKNLKIKIKKFPFNPLAIPA